MAFLADTEPGSEHGSGEKRLSWPVLLLTLAAVTSSSLSALSLYQFVALRAEVEALKSDMSRRREEGPDAGRRGQAELIKSKRNIQEDLQQPPHASTQIRKRRETSRSEMLVSQSCLQLLANSSRKPFSKELPSGPFIGIPWQAGLRRGSALEADGDRIVVREEGLYFVYSQVFYTDKTFTMGHVVIRWKHSIVGNEDPDVHLFRCIQSMSPEDSYNTCYTGGVVKLDVGDHLELLIPRATANISLDGDSTFLGAFKLI
ncbi:tumor necrosis factor ligand superfamily member 13B isoform X2 [Nothobranchius furzeri]|uniref:Transcript variant X1 n=1 Tax=Nothobranchius furzeri TaxID=105023 RepID=A0A1A8AYS0_NOTFU|nr:tumor necrosis factor ligand superfamily member 13B isoform X1 [Nothobranchius furzeri]KAF7215664.1 transcript variant X1 [Nothobranchius furzeri]